MATWVLVDNADPTVTYGEGWTTLRSTDNPVFPGLVVYNTSVAHVVLPNVTTASLAFNFTGSEISLYGPSHVFNVTEGAKNGPEPVWQCSVDGKAVSNNTPYGAFPLQSYCTADGLTDSAHTIQLNDTQNGGKGFWFEYLTYQVFPNQLNSVPQNANEWVDHTDPRLELRQQWDLIPGALLLNMTASSNRDPFKDPVFSMPYNGSFIAWHWLSKAGLELANVTLPEVSPASNRSVRLAWGIGGDNVGRIFGYALPNQSPGSSGNPYSTLLFDTVAFQQTEPGPIDGPHNFTLYYDDNGTGCPLTLDFMVITSGVNTNITVLNPPNVEDANDKSSSKSGTIGGAVGGVVGGIILFGLALYLYRRWKIAQRRQKM